MTVDIEYLYSINFNIIINNKEELIKLIKELYYNTEENIIINTLYDLAILLQEYSFDAKKVEKILLFAVNNINNDENSILYYRCLNSCELFYYKFDYKNKTVFEGFHEYQCINISDDDDEEEFSIKEIMFLIELTKNPCLKWTRVKKIL